MWSTHGDPSRVARADWAEQIALFSCRLQDIWEAFIRPSQHSDVIRQIGEVLAKSP